MSDDQRGARPTLPWAGTLETGEAADVGARQRSTIDLLDARAAVDDAPVGVGQIGRFIVLRRIGVGGMGVVYLAYDNALDRRVAIKVLRGLGPPAPERRARFAREAQAMARLSHPNVVQIYEAGESDGALFLAMEYVRGGSLRTWLLGQDAKDERGATATRGWREIVAMFAQAGRGLAAAHEAGLVHRDFKPDNVLVDGDGVARVGDFGLARLLEEAPAEAPAGPAPALHSLTATRAVMGTPAYMSPEQHAGRPADARTDQFSFCVALWE
ncbi:MAG: serine/threonine protein kinase, partial [Myxococcales bacterium]|nr:serine/threonine protein kinase [Myxococcales bacterium]